MQKMFTGPSATASGMGVVCRTPLCPRFFGAKAGYPIGYILLLLLGL
jgi:hypothetical protein